MYFSNFFSRALVATLLAILVTACGGGGDGDGPAPPPSLPNVINVTVDAGPSGSGYNVNRLYTTVKICQPGTTRCETIDHVLVDTGSTGLRLLANKVVKVDLKQSQLNSDRGAPLLNCVKFLNLTYAWGPVARVDIVLGAKMAESVPIQVIADPAFNSLAAPCSGGGSKPITTADTLGANGILGLGLFKEDCGLGCITNANNGFYYTCTNAGCTAAIGSTASIAKQVKNPVPLFASDNNGVLIDLPAVGSGGASGLKGSLIFGVGTQSNNQLASGGVLTTNSSGYFTTLLAGKSLQTSFIDTGSNGFFFDSATIPPCSGGGSAAFYCPSSPNTLSATLIGANATSIPVSFSIENALTLFADASKTALPTLSGPMGDVHTFDWGLPFFYGRRVFIGIEGQASSLGIGPFYAF